MKKLMVSITAVVLTTVVVSGCVGSSGPAEERSPQCEAVEQPRRRSLVQAEST